MSNFEILVGKSNEFFKVAPNSAIIVILKPIKMNDGTSYEYTVELGDGSEEVQEEV